MSSIPHHKRNRKSMADELSKEMNILLENTFERKNNNKQKRKNLSYSGTSSKPQKSKQQYQSDFSFLTSNYYPYSDIPIKTEDDYYYDNNNLNNNNNRNNNILLDERPSRPLSRWSDDVNSNNIRRHSLDSKRSKPKSNHKKHRNRSFSPHVTPNFNDTLQSRHNSLPISNLNSSNEFNRRNTLDNLSYQNNQYNDDNQISGLIVDSFSMPMTSPKDNIIINPLSPGLNSNNTVINNDNYDYPMNQNQHITYQNSNVNQNYQYQKSTDITSSYPNNNYYKNDCDQELTVKYESENNNQYSNQIPINNQAYPVKHKNNNKYNSFSNNSKLMEEDNITTNNSYDIRRKRSLSKPERSKRRNKYMNYAIENANYVILENSFEENDEPYPNAIYPDFGKLEEEEEDNNNSNNESFKKIWWTMISNACTCYIPNILLEKCNKIDQGVQQAWREKLTLCTIILLICILSGFFTFGINDLLCNNKTTKIHYTEKMYAIHGVAYDIYINNFNETNRLHSVISASKNYDLGPYVLDTKSKSSCQKIFGNNYGINNCHSDTISKYLIQEHRDNKKCYELKDITKNSEIKATKLGNVYYNWDDLTKLKKQENRSLIVYNGNVIDITDYISSGLNTFGQKFTDVIREKIGRDITYTMSKHSKYKKSIKCLNEIYNVGTISKSTAGCITSNILIVLAFIFVIGVIFIKFCMALVFNWFLKWRMGDRSGYIKKLAEEERRTSKIRDSHNSINNSNNNNNKRHILKDSLSLSTLINSKNTTNRQGSFNLFDEKHRRNSTGQIFNINSEENNNNDDKKSVSKQQNRKSMTSRFSIPMPGEGSRTLISKSNSNFNLPSYPNPFRSDGVASPCSLNDLTKPKRNSITSWDPLTPLTNSQSLNIGNNNKRKSIFSTISTPPLDSIFKNIQAHASPILLNSNPIINDPQIKSLPEPTLPDVGILDEEMTPSVINSPSNKRISILPNSTLLNDKRRSSVGLLTNGTSTMEIEENVSPGGPITANTTIKDLLHTILLVTCYSEGHDGIANSLDSLSETDYPDSLKLIIVICDGLVKGEGNDKLTSNIVIDMIDPGDGSNYHDDEPDPKSYVAIAEGKKRHNMAKIYAGWYRYAKYSLGRKIPMIGIIKCGTESERNGPFKSPKPGNRGKRDSQILLLGFLSRVMFNDRMTEFDFELFTKIYELTGVYADAYESIMMVDADTIVDKDSLSHLVACLIEDPKIMGLCGETQIANKRESWVTMIQVFEYYISHHMSKAFESVFGGVTCLPGCFCMYRIKSRKGTHGYWVPILANPEIVEQYSENKVDTLHKKNLLLLGEDRYLSTLMLREFPKRKMVFVPQATCKTIVPNEFKVLLSQRRRWINSTVHNLLELVLVNDLCGTFCFSMQFVVLMELIGTVVLPAAVFVTYYLIGSLFFSSTKNIIPLLLMLVIMALPAILISLTSREMKYILWMIIYLLALPVWNFILPVYSFWHFDDFSWGQTRLVEGEIANKKGDQGSEGEFDSTGIIMKTWEEWEKIRRAEILANEFYLYSTEKNEGDIGNYTTLYNENQPSQINNNNTTSISNNNKRFTGSFNNITLDNRNNYYQE
ncbi:hypothetical protein BCR32DRAFT_270823 [Anaeromyces robustus]|uniref:chitin synthase n=1 Tax=Anaeromyces robustus TaxID=1754192 RepID=A0A1Y1WUI7_9FUNG|nr:hypothetical protein BCR32DRAFT_270823 [Anaeromyces robustus]|eukprot:ORX77173.1 hypothetical protein BCR32DRAFT_270823 [Anaeromyces robustus]